ncbi:MAG: hypothetical protein IJH47_07340 [Oscillospiraceae bacterium]|nr:hypothetical protein [Oscillospiraceae bacterium]
MLGKLIKYDLRSCFRKFWVLWAALAALGVLNGFTIRYVLEKGQLGGFLTFLLGILPIILMGVLVIAIGIMALVYICERFYKGLLGDEGYLMFTLPATTAEHIASKCIVALILEVISALAAALTAFLVALVYDPSSLFEFLGQIPKWLAQIEFPRGTGWLIAEFVILCLVVIAVSNLQIYQAIAIGHLGQKHRGGLALLAYVGINMAVSILVGLLGDRSINRFVGMISFSFDETGLHGVVSSIAGGLGVTLLWNLILGAVFFFGTKLILDKKLNLE